jgi:hypothetical protein
MASQLYPKGKAHLLGLATKADLVADTIKVMAVDNSTTVYNSTHEFVSDLAGGGIVSRTVALTAKTVTGGVFAAANTTFTAVVGPTILAVIVYKDTGADATSPLIAWLDTNAFGPTGGDISLTWNASGIFAI